MDLEEASRKGNEMASDACEELMGTLGTGKEYLCGVTSMASCLMFHIYRLGKRQGNSQEILQAALDDMVHNIERLDGDSIEIVVRRRT